MMQLLDCFIPIFVCVLRIIQQQEEWVEESRQNLLSALMQAQYQARLHGYAPQDIEDASFAVVVWADEAILCTEKEALNLWRLASLQQERYDSALGGYTFFERMTALNTDNYPVRLVYLFCLFCGFRGRYDKNDKNDNLLFENVIQQLIDNLPGEYKYYLSRDCAHLMLVRESFKPQCENEKSRYLKLFMCISSMMSLYVFVIIWLLGVSI